MLGRRTQRRSRLRAGCAACALLGLAGCTAYKPLDAGSAVPWAVERQAVVAAAPEGEPGRNRRDGPVPLAPPVAEPAGADLSAQVHRVRPGEALLPIARRYDVAPARLIEANGLERPYTIYPGQMLRIPSEERAPGATATAAAAPVPKVKAADAPGAGAVKVVEVRPTLKPREERAAREYVVKEGDSLIPIARRAEVPMLVLARANDIDPPYRLRPGQRLVIPDGKQVQTGVPKRSVEVARAPGEPPALSGNGFLWPVDGKVVGRFGEAGDGKRRDGVDIAARKGAPVRAAENGLVVYAGDAIRGYGRMILLRHEGGYVTTYAHNSAILVNVGDVVERGQVIARVGDTGDVARAQLHFELRKGRKPVDPETALVNEPTALASSG